MVNFMTCWSVHVEINDHRHARPCRRGAPNASLAGTTVGAYIPRIGALPFLGVPAYFIQVFKIIAASSCTIQLAIFGAIVGSVTLIRAPLPPPPSRCRNYRLTTSSTHCRRGSAPRGTVRAQIMPAAQALCVLLALAICFTAFHVSSINKKAPELPGPLRT